MVNPPLDPVAIQAAEKKNVSKAPVDPAAEAKKEEKVYEERQKRKLAEIAGEKALLENLSLKQDIEARSDYASRIFWLIVVWLFAIFLVLIFEAWELFGFQLSDSVILALIGGTTASVLALFVVVAKYLFPEKK